MAAAIALWDEEVYAGPSQGLGEASDEKRNLPRIDCGSGRVRDLPGRL